MWYCMGRSEGIVVALGGVEKQLREKVRQGKRGPDGRPRCYACGQPRKLREIERLVSDPATGQLKPKKVLWCGRC